MRSYKRKAPIMFLDTSMPDVAAWRFAANRMVPFQSFDSQLKPRWEMILFDSNLTNVFQRVGTPTRNYRKPVWNLESSSPWFCILESPVESVPITSMKKNTKPNQLAKTSIHRSVYGMSCLLKNIMSLHSWLLAGKGQGPRVGGRVQPMPSM